MKISSLDDIQKLKGKDLGEILKCNSKSMNGIRADLVSKVYALLMWHVLQSSSGENRELLTDVQDLEQNQSDFQTSHHFTAREDMNSINWPRSQCVAS